MHRKTTLFRHFFATLHREQGRPHLPVSHAGEGCWWDDPHGLALAAGRGFNIALVGESQFQDAIGALVGGRCEEGHNCEVPAQLLPLPTERDPDGIAVMINGRQVGWLPFEAARAVRADPFRLIAAGKPVTCKCKIVGGWDRGRGDRGFFGVKLSLSLPLKLHPQAAARRARQARPAGAPA